MALGYTPRYLSQRDGEFTRVPVLLPCQTTGRWDLDGRGRPYGHRAIRKKPDHERTKTQIPTAQETFRTVEPLDGGIIGSPITPFGSYRLFHERADGSGRRTAARYRNDRGTP